MTFVLPTEVVRRSILSLPLMLIYAVLGKSDPYAVFSLNGSKVFKSETKKKTLVPEWNETFEVTVVRENHFKTGPMF